MQKFKQNRSAFTMIEVMMMILIVAIMSSIALPATNNFFAGNRLAAAASILIQDVRRARYRAMQTGRTHRLVFLDATAETEGYMLQEFNGLPSNLTSNSASKVNFDWETILDDEERYFDPEVMVEIDPILPDCIFFRSDGLITEGVSFDSNLIPQAIATFTYGDSDLAVTINAMGVVSSEEVFEVEYD